MNSLENFLLNNTPPKPHHQLNSWETMGNMFLIPISHVVGTFSIRHKANESILWKKVTSVALAIISLPLTIIGMTLKGIGLLLPHKHIIATDETAKICLANGNKIKQYYKLLELLKKVCLEHGFVDARNIPKFILFDGSALGAARHKGIIPWDDDCDLAIFDERGFLKLESALQLEGIELDRSLRFNSIYKCKFTDKKIEELFPDSPKSDPADIDIFVCSEMSDGSFTYDTAYARANWSNSFITREEFQEGFEYCQFGDLELPSLKNPTNYLKRHYGDNCLTHGIETHGHSKILGITISFLKFGAHYFEIIKYKEKHAGQIEV